MSEMIQILKRGDGATVYSGSDGRLKIRYDSQEERKRGETIFRLLQCVGEQKITETAGGVVDAWTDSLIPAQDDLLGYIPDEDTREIIRLELEPILDRMVLAIAGQIEEIWRDD